MASSNQVIRLHPFYYVHVLDNNTFVTSIEVGPQVLTLQEHQHLVEGPSKMIVLPPRSFCKVSDPLVRDKDTGEPEKDQHGNFLLRYGEEEVRFHQPPFPLYPGESMSEDVTPLEIVEKDQALRIECLRDFVDEEGKKHVAQDEWLFRGPGTYVPRVETITKGRINATIVQPNEALRLRALREFTDDSGKDRYTGEVWLMDTPGAYIPSVNEEVEAKVQAYVITESMALHMRALVDFKDPVFGGKNRYAGEEWLITSNIVQTHIPAVETVVVGERNITVLTDMQYCVVLDPVDDEGHPAFGERRVIRGPAKFFLQPGEKLEGNKIRPVEVLNENQALLLQALDDTTDHEDNARSPGEKWLFFGPGEYVPPVEVEILTKQKLIPLDENEGIYVRDLKTGQVSAIMGPQSYMLKENEELWEKHLPVVVESLLKKHSGYNDARDKTRIVTFRAPHNSAVQVYNYQSNEARVVFGPDLVILGPDEHFTVLSLSGGKPKRPHLIKDIALLLGPDFMTDYVVVETADHAKLELRLSYNWQFQAGKGMPQEEAHRLFSVPDFVGDGCKAIASRVRACVAATPFDEFHRSSAKIIRRAVFGLDAEGKVNDTFSFLQNHLNITNIDIKAVEPVDHRTRDMLQRSVQLAIDITTKSVQLDAQQRANREAQAAKGELDNLKIINATEVEKANRRLIELNVECTTSKAKGQAIAEATAKSAAATLDAQSTVDCANLRAEAREKSYLAEVEAKKNRNLIEINYQKEMNLLKTEKARKLAEIEAEKFEALIKSIGADTIAEIARAGPEMQAQLLQGLGLQSFLITDGNSPINLFETANGLIGQPQ
eukprot:CAMPEP_0201552430 /NCGR_PEP_ID=MMETSP0173_2-20130828/16305_1 /ASSEMBLY_ACC=CAM_ASM_000268 /TAXON_ID=218659 /ORGANISM="Vexillifera sp., Strain DIVA3 564/2" /LENGTH=830 /DNA_ID=CAMNT_0047962917 /DNA_START=37 /DNA_END=2529 /DNA_ORIENTATION=+